MTWWQTFPGLRESVLAWLESVRCKDEPWGRYRYSSTMPRAWGLESSCTAIKVLDRLGALDDVAAAERHALGEVIRSLQDPRTGMVVDPLVTAADRVLENHSWEHIWGHATGVAIQTLPLLGTQLAEIRLADDEPRDVAAVQGWLESLPWRDNPWRCGTLIGQFLARHRARAGRYESDGEDAVVAAAMDWLEAHQDPATGLWGTNRGGELYRAMAGLHCMSTGTYYLPCRPLRMPERIIDSVLALQDADGNFAGGGGCLNYDAIKDLTSAARYTSHRHDEIVAATGRLVKRILAAYAKPDGAFSFREEGCMTIHNSVRVGRNEPVSDVIGTHMYLIVLREYAALTRDLNLPPLF